ncbi:helicase-related protein [Arcicella sp. LKC2W]|uniref:helicase-related protein n=1 Tax=Arcicella sp. LKC2W TaxID=2984198 RepID=UPI002B1FB96B|nr:helicase-related protein [Arcicella sp. LKC2W]MEA5462051.1 helicase-related protein [Arcicella sp. LKC2W]
MTPQQEKLLNIYFNKLQQKVINTNETIKNNILQFIETYSTLNLNGLLENNDYKIIYPIRNALDFIAGVRIKPSDNYGEKVNQAFEKLTLFDWKASENLVFCNLLLSEGKLPVLLDKLAENLAMYPVEEIQVNKDLPNDFYESILLISDTHLNILKQQNTDINHIQVNPSLRFRAKSAINHLQATQLINQEQVNPNSQRDNEISSSEVESLDTNSSKTPLENQTTSEEIVSDDIGTSNYPQAVEAAAAKLLDALNDGAKKKDRYHSLSIAKIRIENKEQKLVDNLYFLQAKDSENQEIANVIDKDGKPISSANWRKTAMVDADIQEYIQDLGKAIQQTNIHQLLSTIFDIASHAPDKNAFLQGIRNEKALESSDGKFVMQQLFQIHQEDSRDIRLSKFETWFNQYKITENSKTYDAEPTLPNNLRELPQREPANPVQSTIDEQPIGEPHQPEGRAVYEPSGTSSPARTDRKLSPRITLEQSNRNVEKFYLENTENKFNTAKKLADNLAALEMLNELMTHQRSPTHEERLILSQYVGFGGLKDIVLNPENEGSWGESNQAYREAIRSIRAVLTQLEEQGFSGLLASVQSTILDAFYTSDTVIKGIYEGLNHLGFEKGTILEPSAGTGNFIGFMPTAMREQSRITQVEIDSISSLINQYLYADTKVINKPLQAAGLKNRAYDLVISNIPFGDSRVYDSGFKGELSSFQNRIHNYFTVKALQLAKEGAIVALVASKKVLDSPGNKPVRQYIEENGNFLGAVRLPHKTFDNANTQVNADIIFIQKTAKKLAEDITPIIRDSIRVDTFAKDGTPAHYEMNEYFVKNPQNILGEVRLGGMYDQNDYKVLGGLEEINLAEIITQTLEKAKPTLIPLSITEKQEDNTVQLTYLNEVFADLKYGAIGLLDNQLFKKTQSGEFIELKPNEPIKKIKDYLALKESLIALINAEYSGVNSSEVEQIRDNTRNFHQHFIATYGTYNDSLKKIARLDEDYYNVLSLIDNKGKEADILHFPTIVPLKKVGNATDIQDAITISLYEQNKIDLPFIAQLLEKSVEEIIEESVGLIFYDPTLNDYVHRDEYLSGNVKAKAAIIKAEIEKGNHQYALHLEELEKIMPKDIPANLIEVSIGARWVGINHYNQFIQELLQVNGDQLQLHYNRALDSYEIIGENSNTLTKGIFSTKRLRDTTIIENAFSMELPIVRDKVSSNPDRYVVNKEETAIAAEKVALVKEKFGAWIWKSPQRREELGKVYNDRFNTTVLRKYDGTNLNFEGINGVNLYAHQKDAVWRLLQNNGGIIDHIVGGGKTFIMVAATMKMKQLSIAQKPMIIALKSTVPQIVDAYKKAYPLANILAPTESDFKKENRLALFSKIALNDWDCVIMTHDNFNTIPQSAFYERQQTELELTELKNQIDEIESDSSLDHKTRKTLINRVISQVKKVEARLEKLLDRTKDNTLDFQQMGIDHIMVDESQQFKNLTYTSKIRNVAGMSKQEGSKRAFNLLVAIRSLQDKFGGDKGTTFLSGTPISNSLVEMYLLFKYLRPNKMEELGFNTFDQWATNFAVPKTDIEFSITGEFKPKTRFSEFINVPELAILYTEIADIRNDDNLVLNKPAMLGKGYQVKALTMNEIQKDFGQRIIEFAKTKNGHILGIGKLSEGQENAYMLLATNLANKMSIDMRLIDPSIDYDPSGKVGTLVKTVREHYLQSEAHKGTQLIFSDTGTPKNKSSFGTLMLDYLMDEVGVDAEVLKSVFGEYNGDNYKFPSEDKIRKKLADELLMDDSQIDELYELAKTSEPFNLYDEIKLRLVESGIPAHEVVFIHDYNTAQKKDKLFNQVNAGEIRVVLGSTQKLGTGVNVQERIVALHHIDAPWRPSDMEQRNGRGLRQGNRISAEFYNNELPIYTYCSELSLDTFKYQLLHTKDFLIKQIKNDSIDPSMRVIRESEGDADGGQNFGEILANLSGNTDILEKIKLEGLVQKLEKSKKSFESEIYDALENIQKTETLIPENKRNIERTKQDIEQAQSIPTVTIETEDGRVLNRIKFEDQALGGQVQANRKDFGEYLNQMIINAVYQQPNYVKIPVTNIFGFEIQAEKKDYGFVETHLYLKGKSGAMYSFNNSVIAGVLLNNLEKTLMNFEHLLNAQIQTLQRNELKLIDYQELSNRTWNKDAELLDAKDKLKAIIQRLNNLDSDSVTNELSKDELTKEQLNPLPKTDGAKQNNTAEVEIDWFNLPFDKLPLATTHFPDESGEKRLFMDLPKGNERSFIAIENDFVLVLPPTKSHDYRMFDLPKLSREDCETINQKGKYTYQIYPRAYAEQFITKSIKDELGLVNLLPQKEEQGVDKPQENNQEKGKNILLTKDFSKIISTSTQDKNQNNTKNLNK